MPSTLVDHPSEGVALLIEQYQNKPRMKGILTSYLDEIQELEVASYEVANGYFADSAVGAQLEVLGRVVGQPRRGLDDDTFRAFINARVAANISSGTLPDLIRVVLLAVSSQSDAWDPDVEYWVIHPNTTVFYLGGFSNSVAIAVGEVVRDAAEAKDAIDVLVTEDPDNAFRWDVGPGWDVGNLVYAV